jgi:hypothetical protein
MNFYTPEQLEARILFGLAQKRKWGHCHTSIDNVIKGTPTHLGRQAKDAADNLIKQGLILCKPTSYGKEISLNPERAEEIKLRVRKYFEI